MNAVPSGAQFEIVAGPHRATLVEVGGGIRTLICDRHAVLDGYPRQEMRTGARGTRLIPWPNRLADGVYDFRGTRYQVALTEPEAHNAIHSFLRWRNWTLRERATDRVVLGTVLHPLPGYPFTLDISIDYSVLNATGGDRQTGLAVATTATNLGDTPCPYATGHHPYLTAGTEFINECTLTLDAHTWLPTDDRGLPTGTESVKDTPGDFRTGALIGNTVIDYAFTGLTRDGNGLAWVYLTAPDGRCTRLWADEHYRFIELYTGDTQPPNKQRRGLGVEPMTCASNDFQAGNNLIILDPGRSITTRWGLHPHQP